jgi:hypothetical protein
MSALGQERAHAPQQLRPPLAQEIPNFSARPNRAPSSHWAHCSRSYRVHCGPLGEQSTGTKISATAKHGAGLPFK